MTANTIRFLAADVVQKANSGHPGMPMGMADVAVKLWTQFIKHNPADPEWPFGIWTILVRRLLTQPCNANLDLRRKL